MLHTVYGLGEQKKNTVKELVEYVNRRFGFAGKCSPHTRQP